MEPDPLLSDLSAEERLELCALMIDERDAREQVVYAPPSVRGVLLNILRSLEPTAETIRELAAEAHVDLAPLVDRVRDHGKRGANPKIP